MDSSPRHDMDHPATRPQDGKPILVIDPTREIPEAARRALKEEGYHVTGHEPTTEAPWMILTGLQEATRNNGNGMRIIRARFPKTPVVVLAHKGTVDTIVEAMRAGAADILEHPVQPDALSRVMSRLAQATPEMPSPQGEDYPVELIDPAMQDMLGTARRVAQTQATILIQGESGSGKEVLARYIHHNSKRNQAPFVAVNCAALPEGLLESELFGYEKGAFTGALTRRQGRFEQAQKGTILLDEISEMPSPLQAKLLRVIQERMVDRLGGHTPIQVDIRIIATTNRDLYGEVAKGRFREDLYYRLNVFPLSIPPLRKHPADIPILAQYFVKQAAERNGLPVPRIQERAMIALTRCPWKGNVRELQNVIERAVVYTEKGIILEQHLQVNMDPSGLNTDNHTGQVAVIPTWTLEQMEQELILAALIQHNGNRTYAARQLGVSLRNLRNKLRQYRSRGVAVPAPAGPEDGDEEAGSMKEGRE